MHYPLVFMVLYEIHITHVNIDNMYVPEIEKPAITYNVAA